MPSANCQLPALYHAHFSRTLDAFDILFSCRPANAYASELLHSGRWGGISAQPIAVLATELVIGRFALGVLGWKMSIQPRRLGRWASLIPRC